MGYVWGVWGYGVYGDTYTYIHIYTHNKHTHTHRNTHKPTHTHTYTHIHTHIYPCIRTHTKHIKTSILYNIAFKMNLI